MACCKAGHRTCGQMTSASDCCRSRQQAGPTVAAVKQCDVALVISVPASVLAFFSSVAGPSLPISPTVTLTRPHDPPHLHTFSLLI